MRPPAGVGYLVAACGAAIGVVAGGVQTTVGSEVPAWTGDKADPVRLGILTMLLASVAGVGLFLAHRPRTSTGTRLALLSAVVVVALTCFTTVGRLWLLPGALLLIGAGLAIESWSGVVASTRRNWTGVLIAALGGCQLLLAAGARPALMVVGGLSGLALIGAAAIRSRQHAASAGLVAVGTVPFAVLAWTAIVPVVVALLAAALAYPALGARTAPGD